MDLIATGLFISKLRKEKGLTQKQLADVLNVTDKAVSKWETGKGFPDIASLTALSHYFGITVNDILNGEIIDKTEYEINVDKNITELLSSGEKRERKLRKLTVLFAVTILILIFLSLFFALDIPSYLNRHAQSGYTVVTLLSDTVSITNCMITINHDNEVLNPQKYGQGYIYNSEYGEYRGVAVIEADSESISMFEFEFGFVNSNNWHIVNIALFVDLYGEEITVKQLVTYKTDDNIIISLRSEETKRIGDSSNIFVFNDGVK